LRHTRAADAVRVTRHASAHCTTLLWLQAVARILTISMEADFVDVDAHGYNEGDDE
jgi:hypothetical protein